MVTIAVPFSLESANAPAICVPARVVNISEIPEQKIFRCVVAFLPVAGTRTHTSKQSAGGLGGFFGFGGILTFSIDGRDFAAHGAQICGELSAVVDGVLDAEIEIGNGWKLERAAEVQDAGGVLGGEASKVVEILGKGVGVKLKDVVAGNATFGAGDRVEVEGARDDAAVEAVLGSGDVPGDFGGAAGLRVGAIVGVGSGDGGDDGSGGEVFVFDGREIVLKQKGGLLGSHGDHLESPRWRSGVAAGES